MKKFLFFLPLTLISFLIITNFTIAEGPLKYVPLVSLDTKSGASAETTATGYIKTFLIAFMAVVVAMAIFQTVKGGIKLMFGGDSSGMKTEGWNDIRQAIYGLILALMTYTILNIVNPKLIPGAGLFDNIGKTMQSTKK